MSVVWKITDLNTTQKMVMLALADNADDDGKCWPSIAHIAKKCSLKERAVYGALKSLDEAGYISRIHGERKTTVYKLNPALNAPMHNMHPAPDAGDPLHNMHPTPALNAPRTIIEPSREPSKVNRETDVSRKRVPKARKYPEDFEKGLWDRWPEKRRRDKPKAYTAWREALQRAGPDEILAGLEAYLKSSEVAEGYAPYPAKWLKGDRWEEDFESNAGTPEKTGDAKRYDELSRKRFSERTAQEVDFMRSYENGSVGHV